MSVDAKFTALPPDYAWAVEVRGPEEEVAALRSGSTIGVKLRGGSYRQVELRERVSLDGRVAIFKIVDWRPR